MTFVSEPNNVRVDHEKQQIVLSAIFDMYRNDFVRELTRRGLPSDGGVVDYVASVAPESLKAELKNSAAYKVSFADYDWAIAASK